MKSWMRGERAPSAGRTAIYVLSTILLVGGSVGEFVLGRRWGLLAYAATACVLAAVALVRRVRDPWWLPVVSLLSVPVFGNALTLPALTSLAARRRGRATWMFAALAFLAVFAPSFAQSNTIEISAGVDPGDAPSLVVVAVSNAVLVAMAALVGSTIRTRRELLASLEDRAVRAVSERATRAREAVLLERSRIAREMHDVLGHRLALVTMQAGALEVNADAGPDVVEREAG